MRNIILFLIIGTLVTLVLIAGCSAVCAAIIILLAKFVNERIFAALPFAVIAGIVLSFFFYGKIMKKIMNKYGLNNKK
ncbi:hypothetical protein ABK01_04335 [Treponema sp. OMZ 305]|uniref:hypothetical protein n=1 Tax=Treponema TaxID=157 RepID=UPI001BB0A5F7|nr:MULTISPECIES: hypothetical protein [Treponema]QUY17679.1 hypothetical protein GWP40_04375 [Treponema vincentii]UTC57564.1 hypothetical protein ABK01_04335 [Treponema sp. OMZ 305]